MLPTYEESPRRLEAPRLRSRVLRPIRRTCYPREDAGTGIKQGVAIGQNCSGSVCDVETASELRSRSPSTGGDGINGIVSGGTGGEYSAVR